MGVLLTQMSAKVGIKKYRDRAIKVLFTEFMQLSNKLVFVLLMRKYLTKKKIKEALGAISVLKEKRCRKLKGRTYVDGRPQHFIYWDIDIAYLTVHHDVFIIVTMIEAKERRAVRTGNVTGAFLIPD